jgi:hypothetical protein
MTSELVVATALSSGSLAACITALIRSLVMLRRAQEMRVDAAVRQVRAHAKGQGEGGLVVPLEIEVRTGVRKLDNPDVAAEYVRLLVAQQRDLDAEARDGDY